MPVLKLSKGLFVQLDPLGKPGDIDAQRLASEVQDSERNVDPVTTAVIVAEMKSEFAIARQMALRLCDAVSSRTLPGEALRRVAFVIISSDHLTWADDELLGEIFGIGPAAR